LRCDVTESLSSAMAQPAAMGGVFRNDDLMGAIEIDEFLDLRHPMLH